MGTKARKTNDRRWSRAAATRDLPTIAFSGPACCCNVADLSQAFSQPTGPGRLWISLGAGLLLVPIGGQTPPLERKEQRYSVNY